MDATGTVLDGKWDELVNRARCMVIETVRTRTGIDLQPLIIDEEINSPLTCESYDLKHHAYLSRSLIVCTQGRRSSIWIEALSLAFHIASCD